MTWNFDSLVANVAAKHGIEQSTKLQECLSTLADRLWMAKFRYSEAKRLLSSHLDVENRIEPVLLEFDISSAASNQYHVDKKSAFAHVAACLQCAHTLSDTLAHVIYFALAPPSKIAEHRIAARTVVEEITKNSSWTKITSRMNALCEHFDYVYLSAIVNHSKHRSLLSPEVVHVVDGGSQQLWSLEMNGFYRPDSYYFKGDVLPFLRAEVLRQSTLIVDIGRELEAMTK
jgi:leucyl-tRNA synthetase